MKKVAFLLVALLLAAGRSFAQSSPDEAVGVWLSEDRASKIEVFKTGSTYTGKLLWTADMYERDGKTSKKDDHNPDPALCHRELKNLVIISGLAYADGGYTGGTYYYVENGSTYLCNMTLKGGKMLLRGYMGVPMLGRTYVWTRVP